jgi:plastocyanin
MIATLLRWAAALAACAAPCAFAGTVQVSVLGTDGQPVAGTVVLLQPTAPWSAQTLPEPAVIAQKDVRFVPAVTVVPLGGSIRLVNRDNYDHHVRSLPGGPLGTVPAAKQFEIRLAAVHGSTEASSDIKLDVPGSIVLGCHLHGSMRGHVYVSVTPWAAVSDAQGRVTLQGVPDGQAELRLWHPDQLVEQGTQRLQVAGTMAADAKLNFTPRRRSPPKPVEQTPYQY